MLLIRANSNGERGLHGKLVSADESQIEVLLADGSTNSISKKDTVSIKLDDFDDDFGGDINE